MYERHEIQAEWANESRKAPPDPTVAENEREAVSIKQVDGKTVVIGNEETDEWIKTEDLDPLHLSEEQ